MYRLICRKLSPKGQFHMFLEGLKSGVSTKGTTNMKAHVFLKNLGVQQECWSCKPFFWEFVGSGGNNPPVGVSGNTVALFTLRTGKTRSGIIPDIIY